MDARICFLVCKTQAGATGHVGAEDVWRVQGEAAHSVFILGRQ